MNYLESLYCYLYQSRIDSGEGASGQATSGNIVLALCLIMLIFGIGAFILSIFSNLFEPFQDLLSDIFGRKSGKFIGRFSVVILLLLFYPLINYTIGSAQNYSKLIEKYKAMQKNEQVKISKQGKQFFFVSLGALAIGILSLLIRTYA